MKFGYVIYGNTLLFKHKVVVSLVCVFWGPIMTHHCMEKFSSSNAWCSFWGIAHTPQRKHTSRSLQLARETLLSIINNFQILPNALMANGSEEILSHQCFIVAPCIVVQLSESLTWSLSIQISFRMTFKPFLQPRSSILMALKTWVPRPRSGSAPKEDKILLGQNLLGFSLSWSGWTVNMNCVSCSETHSIVGSKLRELLSANAKAEKSLTRSSGLYHFVSVLQISWKYKKNIHTEIKLNGSLTMTEEWQKHQTLAFTSLIIMVNAARRHGSSCIICCMLHMHLCTF